MSEDKLQPKKPKKKQEKIVPLVKPKPLREQKEPKKVEYLKATLLLPVNNKDDVKVANKLEKQLLEEFGGYTRMGTCIGMWKNHENCLHKDTNMHLFLTIKKQELPKLRKLVFEYKKETKEEAIYLDYCVCEMELI